MNSQRDELEEVDLQDIFDKIDNTNYQDLAITELVKQDLLLKNIVNFKKIKEKENENN